MDFEPRATAYISSHRTKPQEPLPVGVTVKVVTVQPVQISWLRKIEKVVEIIGREAFCRAISVSVTTLQHWLAQRREPNDERKAKIDAVWNHVVEGKHKTVK
jgi:DNA-binding transcriptional regulator YiaG